MFVKLKNINQIKSIFYKYFKMLEESPFYGEIWEQIETFWKQNGIHLLNLNNTNTIARCEMCSKLTIKTPELYCCQKFVVNIFEIFKGAPFNNR